MAISKGNIVLLISLSIIAGAISFFTYRNRKKIIAVSKAFIGQQEISGNTGFQNDEMERLMKEVGWKPGDAWCVYFAKLMWWLKSPEWLKPKIKTAISGSSQQTWQNVSNDPAFVVSKIPRPGDMVIWQTYKNGVGQSSGHAGIVTKVNINNFQTVEGNTSGSSGTNEGIAVAERVREYNFDANNGLRLKGFVRFA
jgi:hypothetical protein